MTSEEESQREPTATWTWTPGTTLVPAITMTQDLGRMPGGGSAARLILGSDGDRWVMKSHVFGGQVHRFLCFNEALSGQVGCRLGVNVPEVRAVRLTTEQLHGYNAGSVETDAVMVASRLIEPAEALSPSVAEVANRAEMAAITVFDALVWNTDRKEEHILAHAHGSGWRLYAIGMAMGDNLAGALDPTASATPPVQLLREHLDPSDLEPWLDRAAQIRRSEFADMVHSLPFEWVVEPDAAESVADALFARVRSLQPALAAHFA
jgi:hypothetical protein